MSLHSLEDTTVPPFTTTRSPSSPPPISIPFRFKPKRSLSPTAHDSFLHGYSTPADPATSPPTNTDNTTSPRSKRKRSLSPAEPSIPGPRPTNTPSTAPSTIKPIRFKRFRGASYRPNYPDVPTAKEAANHNHRSPSVPLNDDPPPSNPSKPTSQKYHRSRKQQKRSSRHHPHSRHSRHPDDADENPTHNTQWGPDPDTAFRESLFDAMADDEGAAFWEQVYGQPIHTYSAYYHPSPSSPSSRPNDPDHPKLEKMTEEEYVRYVRSKMYEKSYGYIREERGKREEARKAARRKQERARKRWDGDVEEALRRGEERRRRNGKWEGVWEEYLGAWNGGAVGEKGGKGYVEGIRWPVRSGQRRDVGREEIKKFFECAPQSGGGGGGNVDVLEVLKKERVRWHPDKVQQRAGEGGLDVETTKLVTAVFQIIDRLWSERKGGD